MIKSYLKMAWRALAKNKLFSIINIGGLSLATVSVNGVKAAIAKPIDRLGSE